MEIMSTKNPNNGESEEDERRRIEEQSHEQHLPHETWHVT
jgi:hypothetical protein